MLEVALIAALLMVVCVPSLGLLGKRVESRIHDQGVAIAKSSELSSNPANQIGGLEGGFGSANESSNTPASGYTDAEEDYMSAGGPPSWSSEMAGAEGEGGSRNPEFSNSASQGGAFTISPPRWLVSMGGAEGECC
jgi:hypothetical protein